MRNKKGQKILVVPMGNMGYNSKEEILNVCEENFKKHPKDYPAQGYKIYHQLSPAVNALETGKRIFLIRKVEDEFTLNEVLID